MKGKCIERPPEFEWIQWDTVNYFDIKNFIGQIDVKSKENFDKELSDAKENGLTIFVNNTYIKVLPHWFIVRNNKGGYFVMKPEKFYKDFKIIKE